MGERCVVPGGCVDKGVVAGIADNEGGVDLVFLIDGTSSMGDFLLSLRSSIPQAIAVANMTSCFRRVRVGVYRDYSEDPVTEWSPWLDHFEKAVGFLSGQTPRGGGDNPEALKTALMELAEQVQDGCGSETLVMLMADAPPHYGAQAKSPNFEKEKTFFMMKGWSHDWFDISRQLARKSVRVHAITAFPTESAFEAFSSFFAVLSHVTRGSAFAMLPTRHLHDLTLAAAITNATVGLLMATIGQHCGLHERAAKIVLEKPEHHELLCTTCGSLKENCNFLPSHAWPVPLYRFCTARAGSLEAGVETVVEVDLEKQVKRFSADCVFADLVYQTFEALVNPETIESLTCNPIFGRLWREICKRRKDERLKRLLQNVDSTLRTLCRSKSPVYESVKKWLEKSYFNAQVVRQVSEIDSRGKTYPCLVLENEESLKPQELLQLARLCGAESFKKISNMMNSLRVVNDAPRAASSSSEDSENKGRGCALPKRYLPLSMSNTKLFSMLPHLMCEGMVFSLRLSVVVAALAFVNRNEPLVERAGLFLEKVRGKWFDAEVPENFVPGFARLCLRLPAEFLTSEETAVFRKVCISAGLRANEKTHVTLKLPFTPNKSVGPDFKFDCAACGEKRSFTLMAGESLCGLCAVLEDGSYGKETPEDIRDNRSVWVQCFACSGQYAVVSVDCLSIDVNPKCHFCRNGIADPKMHNIQCSKCTNWFLDPSQRFRRGVFVCPSCEANPGSAKYDEVAVTLKQLTSPDADGLCTMGGSDVSGATKAAHCTNREAILRACGLKLADGVGDFFPNSFCTTNLDKVLVDGTAYLDGGQQEIGDACVPSLTWQGKTCFNSRDVLKELRQWVLSGDAQRGECVLCFEYFKKTDLRDLCGNPGCVGTGSACSACLNNWYGVTRPGQVILPPRLVCPYCKRVPRVHLLRKINRELCLLLQRIRVRANNRRRASNANRETPEPVQAALEEVFEPNWYTGWCVQCYEPKRFVEKSCCAEDALPRAQGGRAFVCHDCEQEEQRRAQNPFENGADTRQCPGCKADVYKTGGCDHMTCICGCHWCWACGKPFDEEDIYDHIYDCVL